MRLIPLVAALVCALALPSAAQQANAPPVTAQAAAPVPAAHPLTAEDLDAWLDGYIPTAMEQADVAGAVVVVVANGQILFQKGYGYADVENRVPVDPERTLFRTGSVGKLYTWTAVMQLVEQGRLDLDANINTYLDFEMPGRPITLRNIMTHTSGLEELLKGLLLDHPSQHHPLAERMAPPWIPEQIFEPGTTPAYSNYATALAGYIVERVSAERFEDYIENHIFQPLGMNYATFQQDMPEHLQPYLSNGYRDASSPPLDFEVVDLNPAGGSSISGADMARFMLAHLQNGALGDARILRPETVQQMQTTEYEGIPGVNHMLLGFYQRNYNGRRAIGHGGATVLFSTDLALFPDDGVGFYIAVNSASGGRVQGWLFENFVDRYLPGPRPQGEVDAETAAAHARMIEGVYQVSRRQETSPVAAASAMRGGTRVTAGADGTINVSGDRWVEIAPFVWRQEDGSQRMAAVVENGRVTRFAQDGSPFQVWYRVSPAFGLLPQVLMGSFAILVLTTVFWPVNAFLRWRFKTPFPLAGREALAYRALVLTAALPVAAIAWWFFKTFPHLLPGEGLISDGSIVALRVLTLLVTLAAVIAALWNAFEAWKSSQRGRWSKLWGVLTVLAALITLAFVVKYHLVGFDAAY